MDIISGSRNVSSELLQSTKLKLGIKRLINDRKKLFQQYCHVKGIDADKIDKKERIYGILPPCDLLPTHTNSFVKSIHSNMGSHDRYIKTPINKNINNTMVNFNSTVSFIIPNEGQAVSECVLHLKISAIKSKYDVKYVDYPGHKILDNIKITITDKFEWEYNPELYNIKCYLGHNKSNSCMGQSQSYTYDEINSCISDEYNIRGFISNGYQTYKKNHDEMDLYIPMHIGIKEGNSIPILKNTQLNENTSSAENNINITVNITSLENLLSFRTITNDIDSENNSRLTSDRDALRNSLCHIKICEFYTKHKFIKGENWMLTISKWPSSVLTTYEIFNKEINFSEGLVGNCSFTVKDCLINNIYVSFRPIENFTKPSYWFSNTFIRSHPREIINKNLSMELQINRNSDNASQLICYKTSVYTKHKTVKKLRLDISNTTNDENVVFENITIDHDVNFLSDYMAANRSSVVNEEFGPWYIFSNLCSSNTDISSMSDKKMTFTYTLSQILDQIGPTNASVRPGSASSTSRWTDVSKNKQLMLIVIVEKKNILCVDGKNIFKKFNITDETKIF